MIKELFNIMNNNHPKKLKTLKDDDEFLNDELKRNNDNFELETYYE